MRFDVGVVAGILEAVEVVEVTGAGEVVEAGDAMGIGTTGAAGSAGTGGYKGGNESSGSHVFSFIFSTCTFSTVSDILYTFAPPIPNLTLPTSSIFTLFGVIWFLHVYESI